MIDRQDEVPMADIIDPGLLLDDLLTQCPLVPARDRNRVRAWAAELASEERLRLAWSLQGARRACLRLGIAWPTAFEDNCGKTTGSGRPILGDNESGGIPMRTGTGWWVLHADDQSAFKAISPDWMRRQNRVLRVCQRCGHHDGTACGLMMEPTADHRRLLLEQFCRPRELIREALIFQRYIHREGVLPETDDEWDLPARVEGAVQEFLEADVDPERLSFQDARLFLTQWVPAFLLREGAKSRAHAHPDPAVRDRPTEEEASALMRHELLRQDPGRPDEGDVLRHAIPAFAEALDRLHQISPFLSLLCRLRLVPDKEAEETRSMTRTMFRMAPPALSKREADADWRLGVLYGKLLANAPASDVGARILEAREFNIRCLAPPPEVRHEWQTVRTDLSFPGGSRELQRLRNDAAHRFLVILWKKRPTDALVQHLLDRNWSTLTGALALHHFDPAAKEPPVDANERSRKGDGEGPGPGRADSSRHPSDEILTAYGMGALEPDASRKVTSHLLGCRDIHCHRQVAAATLLHEGWKARLDAPCWRDRVASLLQGLAEVIELPLVPSLGPQRGTATGLIEPGARMRLDLSVLPPELDGCLLLVFHQAPAKDLCLVHPAREAEDAVRVRRDLALEDRASAEPGEHVMLVLLVDRVPSPVLRHELASGRSLEDVMADLAGDGVTVRTALVSNYRVEDTK